MHFEGGRHEESRIRRTTAGEQRAGGGYGHCRASGGAGHRTPDSSVETVIVTAEKRSEQVKNVPMSMSVLGENQLNNLNIRNFEDLMSQVPGLSFSEADPDASGA